MNRKCKYNHWFVAPPLLSLLIISGCSSVPIVIGPNLHVVQPYVKACVNEHSYDQMQDYMRGINESPVSDIWLEDELGEVTTVGAEMFGLAERHYGCRSLPRGRYPILSLHNHSLHIKLSGSNWYVPWWEPFAHLEDCYYVGPKKTNVNCVKTEIFPSTRSSSN